jgi:hypothetical protein
MGEGIVSLKIDLVSSKEDETGHVLFPSGLTRGYFTKR